MTDDEIIARVRNGETRLFEELVVRYQDVVYATATRMLGGTGDAEDASQEIFLRVYRSLDRFHARSRFSTWLYRVAYNHCLDRLRARKRGRRHTVPLEDAPPLPDERANVEDTLQEAEEARAVRTAVDALEPLYRGVLVLHYDQGLSYDEIAEVLGVPVKTVETRLYRARKMVRRALHEAS